MDDLQSVLAQQDTANDREVVVFGDHVNSLVRKALAAVALLLGGHLVFAAGRVVNNAYNRAYLARTDKLFLAELNRAGLTQLIDAFMGRFNSQINWFKEILLATPGGEKFAESANSYSPDTARNLALFQQNTAEQIEELIQRSAQNMRYALLRSLGNLKKDEVLAVANAALDSLPAQLSQLSSTSVSTFYRTVADIGFQKIEAVHGPLAYRYVGPPSGDPVIRPFCEHLMKLVEGGRTFTRAEINAMDNGQRQWGMGDVFTSGGGFQCRHGWAVVVEVPSGNPA